MTKSDHLALLAEALRDIDPVKLPHGLEQYARFGPRTVRAILEVRDLVVLSPHLSDSRFRIGLTANLPAREAIGGSVHIRIGGQDGFVDRAAAAKSLRRSGAPSFRK